MMEDIIGCNNWFVPNVNGFPGRMALRVGRRECDQIGLFLKDLDDKLSYKCKVAQIFGNYLWYLRKGTN